MIDIVLISSSTERAPHIIARLEESGVAYRLSTAYGTVRQLRMHTLAIRSADLLIVDDVDLSARELDGVEEALVCTPNLHCMLVTPAPSAALLSAAMRVGVRHVLSWPPDGYEIAATLTHIDATKSAGARCAGRVVSYPSSPRPGTAHWHKASTCWPTCCGRLSPSPAKGFWAACSRRGRMCGRN